MAGMGREPSLNRSPSGMASPRFPRSRTQSISSDRPSTVGQGFMSPPLAVSPEAAFIASSAASQIVTNDHDSHAEQWYDDSGMLPAGETALVSEGALQLVNNFLDQLLLNFLQVAKATTLSALRPAVTDILKPKLAKDAINNADEELHEYLGGGDEDDYVQPRGSESGRDWDVELVWKRTRLRCMVYSSLGDMEEEDEDLYMEQENLEIGADEQISDVISPAVAIFLTSVLEYMGELTLTVAGQAAFQRTRISHEKELREGTRTTSDIADRIVVDDGDMERVALDRTLGRLWRGWKKRIRTTPGIMEAGARSFSRASISHHRNGSNTTDAPIVKPPVSDDGMEPKQNPAVIETLAAGQTEHEQAGETLDQEHVVREPADVPLPMRERDIDEIEVPGLAAYSDDEGDEADDDAADALTSRPKSYIDPDALMIERMIKPSTTRARSSSQPNTPSHRYLAFKLRNGYSNEEVSSIEGGDQEVFEEARTEQPQEEVADTDPLMDDLNAMDPSLREGTDPAFEDAEAIGVARTTDERGRDHDMDSIDDVDAYEKAEVVTSSRVSVASSSPPSISDSGGVRQSDSSRSARIVDVAAHKRSESQSRSPTTEEAEDKHQWSSRASPAPQAPRSPSPDESRRPRAVENLARGAAQTSQLRTSLDRVRPSLQNEAIISESEEEEAADDSRHRTTNGKKAAAPTIVIPPTQKTSVARESSPRSSMRQSGNYQGPRKSSLSRSSHHGHQNTKVTGLGSPSSGGAFMDEPIPEVPPRSPGRGGFASDSRSGYSLERIRTADSDETPPYPIQSSSQRQTHTSDSSGSSATGRLKPVRTSEEHVPSHAESVARNFEELIQSNQTITYTLTPEHMRNMDVSAPNHRYCIPFEYTDLF